METYAYQVDLNYLDGFETFRVFSYLAWEKTQLLFNDPQPGVLEMASCLSGFADDRHAGETFFEYRAFHLKTS